MKCSNPEIWSRVNLVNCTQHRLIGVKSTENSFPISISEMVLDGTLSKEKLPSANSIFNLNDSPDRFLAAI